MMSSTTPLFLEAIRTFIKATGDNPDREGLRETPQRVAKAFEEYFQGYQQDPSHYLETHFENVDNYVEPVTLKDIAFYSHCEHHLAPMHGVVTISYIPDKKIVGISKLARVVQVFARRLQIQENMTTQIACCLQNTLNPKGVAVYVKALHHCMLGRGVNMSGCTLVTYHFTGLFQRDADKQKDFKRLCLV